MFQSDVELLLFLLLLALGGGLLGATLIGARDYRQGLSARFGCLPALLAAALIGAIGIVVLLLLLDFAPDPTQWLLLVGLPAAVIVAVGWLALRFDRLPYPAPVGYGIGALALVLALMLAVLPLSGGGGGLGGPTPTLRGPTPTAPVPPLSPSATASPPATSSAPATPTPTVPATATATASATSSPTASPAVARTEFFDVLVERGLLTEARVDDYLDDYRTDPLMDHSHASGEAPGYTPPFVDIRGHIGFSWTISEADAQAIEDEWGCATGNGVRVDCFSPQAVDAGAWIFVVVLLDEALPDELSENQLVTQAVVFDADADPATGYQPDAAFPGDSYQGSVRWYEMTRLGDQRITFATDAAGDAAPQRGNLQSRARMLTWPMSVAGGAEFVLMVPAEEMSGLDFYRGVVVGSLDASTFAPADTSHDFTEADGPFEMHMLEVY